MLGDCRAETKAEEDEELYEDDDEIDEAETMSLIEISFLGLCVEVDILIVRFTAEKPLETFFDNGSDSCSSFMFKSQTTASRKSRWVSRKTKQNTFNC